MADSTRRRIQVHLPSGRKFLQIARDGDRIADLAWAIATKAGVLYDEGPPVVRSLRDQYGYDIDPDDFVFDVFDDRDRCYVQARPIQAARSALLNVPAAKRSAITSFDGRVGPGQDAAPEVNPLAVQHSMDLSSSVAARVTAQPGSESVEDGNGSGAVPSWPLASVAPRSKANEVDNSPNEAVEDTVQKNDAVPSPDRATIPTQIAADPSGYQPNSEISAVEAPDKVDLSCQESSDSDDASSAVDSSSDDDCESSVEEDADDNRDRVANVDANDRGVNEKTVGSKAQPATSDEPSSASDWSFSDDDDPKDAVQSQADARPQPVQAADDDGESSIVSSSDDEESDKNVTGISNPRSSSSAREVAPDGKSSVMSLSSGDCKQQPSAAVKHQVQTRQVEPETITDDAESSVVSFSSDEDEEDLLEPVEISNKSEAVLAVRSQAKNGAGDDKSDIDSSSSDQEDDGDHHSNAADGKSVMRPVTHLSQDKIEIDDDAESSASDDNKEGQPKKSAVASKSSPTHNSNTVNDVDDDAESSVVSTSDDDDSEEQGGSGIAIKPLAASKNNIGSNVAKHQANDAKANDAKSSVASSSDDDEESSIVSSSSDSGDAAAHVEFTKFREVVSAKRQPELLTSLATGRQRQTLRQSSTVKTSTKVPSKKAPPQSPSSSTSSSSSSSASAVKTIADSKVSARTRNSAFLSLADDTPTPKHAVQSIPERSTRLKTPKSQVKSKSLGGLRANLEGSSVLASANKKRRK